MERNGMEMEMKSELLERKQKTTTIKYTTNSAKR